MALVLGAKAMGACCTDSFRKTHTFSGCAEWVVVIIPSVIERRNERAVPEVKQSKFHIVLVLVPIKYIFPFDLVEFPALFVDVVELPFYKSDALVKTNDLLISVALQ